MARTDAPAYLSGVIKDVLLLIAGLALAALSWPLLTHGHLQMGRYGVVSIGGLALFLGLALIVVAIADWRYRRQNAQGS